LWQALGLRRPLRRKKPKFQVVFDAIRQLMAPPAPPKRAPIGFGREREGD
jgi:hypothetical protein